jgi:hypothetical protein
MLKDKTSLRMNRYGSLYFYVPSHMVFDSQFPLQQGYVGLEIDLEKKAVYVCSDEKAVAGRMSPYGRFGGARVSFKMGKGAPSLDNFLNKDSTIEIESKRLRLNVG